MVIHTMQKINSALSKLANGDQFQKRYEALKNEVLEDQQIHEFLHENSSIVTGEIIDKGLVKLYEFSTQSKNCDRCPGLEGCINLMKGFTPKLVIEGNSIDLHYEVCPRKAAVDEKRKREKLIRSLYVPSDILSATITNFFQTDPKGRGEMADKVAEFIESYVSGKKHKALYIHGKFGVGKTYLLGAIANEFAERRISSLIIYFPDFLRELKGSIGDNTVNEKIEMVKQAPVLMIDDLGAESMTSWARDEVLGTILQFRMLENLPTFFSSNFDFEELENHLTFSQRGEKEEVKAARIMERIKYLAEPVELAGENRRQ